MRHLYRCPLRWADMDLLAHVNNVTYVDYLQEARIDMLVHHAPVRGGEELGEGVVVVRHEVDYVHPLVFREEPVSIETWVTDVRAATFTMAYEVFDEAADGSRTVYLRARSVLTPYVFAEERPRRLAPREREVLATFLDPTTPALRPDGVRRCAPLTDGTPLDYDLRVRWSDVDAYGHVNNVKYFEYLQEARIACIRDLGQGTDEALWVVVAGTDVDYLHPVLFRTTPYLVTSRIARVGGASVTIASEIRDSAAADARVYARGEVVIVKFDRSTQRSAPLSEAQRARLVALRG
ncbi:MAG: thioesterase family protein [Nocardioides sp.]|nr:thioesterase family protein [Nocardioides sp.]